MEESRTAVIVAGVANLAIAVMKFLAAAVTHSSAMLSEGIHSLVDTADQVLLLFGEQRSKKPADDEHPFGYGHELYFWTLVVSLLIFGVGGGVSFYEGVRRLGSGATLEDPTWSYVVLAASAVFESVSWVVALRKLGAQRGGRSYWRTFRESKDPLILTVVVEDSAALIGLVIAFLGVLGGHVFGAPALDAIASLCIGVLLMGVALLLARESRSLLVGESAGKESVERMRRSIARERAVVGVGGIWTLQLAPGEILVNCEIAFQPGAAIEEAIQRVERLIREAEPRARRIFIEAASGGPRKRGEVPGAPHGPSTAAAP